MESLPSAIALLWVSVHMSHVPMCYTGKSLCYTGKSLCVIALRLSLITHLHARRATMRVAKVLGIYQLFRAQRAFAMDCRIGRPDVSKSS